MSILLIEDDKKFAVNLKRALEIENYAVDIASDGVSGLSRGMDSVYRLIVLDVALPQMDGLTVCRTLREHNVRTPIIMLTARGEVHDRVHGLDSGADDYLVKPFEFEELFARLRALMRRNKKNEQPILKIDNIIVDLAKHEVARAGIRVSFSPTEYKLFLYLLQHRNMVVERNTLTKYLWDTDLAGNKLDVYVRYIRKKLEDVSPRSKSKEILHTIKGVGYIIKE